MLKKNKKGSILIAITFVIILSITAINFLFMVGGKTAFVVNQLKRPQAVACAEAAIYETFNRFRAGVWSPAVLSGAGWQNSAVNVPIFDPDDSANPKATVPVDILVTGNTPPYQIRARVHYEDVSM